MNAFTNGDVLRVNDDPGEITDMLYFSWRMGWEGRLGLEDPCHPGQTGTVTRFAPATSQRQQHPQGASNTSLCGLRDFWL
jgi:hypothetical protein